MDNFEFIEPEQPLPPALQLAQDTVAQTRAYHQWQQTRASQLADATLPPLTYAGQSNGQTLLRTPEGNLFRAGQRDSNGALLPGVADIVSGSGVVRVGGMPRVKDKPETGAIFESLDIYLLIDISGSFRNDISTIKGLLGNLFGPSLQAVKSRLGARNLRFGLGTFSGRSDPLYTHRVRMTDQPETILKALNAVEIDGGLERQLEALMAAAQNPEVGFSEMGLKLIAVMTDEIDEKYASGQVDLNQVRTTLLATKITPIFLIALDPDPEFEGALEFWQAVHSALGKGVIEEITSDSSDLVEALLKALGRI